MRPEKLYLVILSFTSFTDLRYLETFQSLPESPRQKTNCDPLPQLIEVSLKSSQCGLESEPKGRRNRIRSLILSWAISAIAISVDASPGLTVCSDCMQRTNKPFSGKDPYPQWV